MKLLEQRILSEGKILPGGILRIDSFLNHQIDSALMYEMASEIARLYKDCGVNKVFTVEASGIAFATMTAYHMSCPMLFAKKSKTKNISDNVYSASVDSYTHGVTNMVVVSKDYLNAEDRVLIADDFLATGAALVGLKQLVEQAGATVVGAGILVEKVFQGGGDKLRAEGMRIESLARIAEMNDSGIRFC